MALLRINGKEVEVADGATLLAAAQAAGVGIPTLCHLKETGALTSCMICAVWDKNTGRLLPACASKAVDGMDIDTDCEKVHGARREVLHMLLDEHVGDCEGPCARICPAGLNIPRMLRHIEAGDAKAAARRAKLDLIFPATLGHVCTAPCERVCRRGQYDTAIAIRRSHREVSLPFLHGSSVRDARRPATGKSVAVVGAGLAGMSAAWECALRGHSSRVYEKTGRAGGALCALSSNKLPPDVLEAEIGSLRGLGVEFVFNNESSMEALLEQHDAVVVACDMSFAQCERIFTAKEEPLHVRSVGNGKKAAREVNAFLSGAAAPSAEKCFNSSIGRLRENELGTYEVERRRDAVQATPSDGLAAEAARCLHCDCGKPVSCKLRRYAQQYGLAPQITRIMDRHPVAAIQSTGRVLFEPGKCIKCGICVEIVRASGLDDGIAFAGRGLESHLAVPFGAGLDQGLGAMAEHCARACPTAALSLRGAEET